MVASILVYETFLYAETASDLYGDGLEDFAVPTELPHETSKEESIPPEVIEVPTQKSPPPAPQVSTSPSPPVSALQPVQSIQTYSSTDDYQTSDSLPISSSLSIVDRHIRPSEMKEEG